MSDWTHERAAAAKSEEKARLTDCMYMRKDSSCADQLPLRAPVEPPPLCAYSRPWSEEDGADRHAHRHVEFLFRALERGAEARSDV